MTLCGEGWLTCSAGLSTLCTHRHKASAPSTNERTAGAEGSPRFLREAEQGLNPNLSSFLSVPIPNGHSAFSFLATGFRSWLEDAVSRGSPNTCPGRESLRGLTGWEEATVSGSVISLPVLEYSLWSHGVGGEVHGASPNWGTLH